MLVLSRATLIAQLGGPAQLRTALRRGSWQRVLHGAYTGAGGPLDLRVRAQAARLLLPPRTLVADRCLLWLLGLDVLPAGPPMLEVVVPRGAVVPRRSGVRARECEVPRSDRGMLAELPVLRPTRAVADLLRLLLVLAGLAPIPQYEVQDARGAFVARVDLAFPGARLALEYDGREAHGDAAFVRDRRRQNALLAVGWRVLRYTSEDLRHGAWGVVAEVRRALQVAA